MHQKRFQQTPVWSQVHVDWKNKECVCFVAALGLSCNMHLFSKSHFQFVRRRIDFTWVTNTSSTFRIKIHFTLSYWEIWMLRMETQVLCSLVPCDYNLPLFAYILMSSQDAQWDFSWEPSKHQVQELPATSHKQYKTGTGQSSVGLWKRCLCIVYKVCTFVLTSWNNKSEALWNSFRQISNICRTLDALTQVKRELSMTMDEQILRGTRNSQDCWANAESFSTRRWLKICYQPGSLSDSSEAHVFR